MAMANNRTAGGNAAFHNFNNDYAHIADPNERRRLALAEIDKAPFGWYHVRACVVAGVGFFTDAYDIFAINLVTPMVSNISGYIVSIRVSNQSFQIKDYGHQCLRMLRRRVS